MPKPMYVWTGSAWVAVASEVESLSSYATQSYADNTPGMKLIVPTSVAIGSGSSSTGTQGSVTFSGCSSVSLNGVFTSSYTNYRVLINYNSTAATGFYLRLRASGTDETTSTYAYAAVGYTTGGASSNANSSSATFYQIGRSNNSTNIQNQVDLTLWSPQVSARRTGLTYNNFWDDGTNVVAQAGGGSNSNSSSYDGLTIYTASGNITGDIRVYGFKIG